MPDFPKTARVNVPAGILLGGECFVSVRIKPQHDVHRVKEVYGKRLFNLELDGESLSNIEFVRALTDMRVRILRTDFELFNMPELVNALLDMEAVFVVRPDAKLIRNVNFLTSLNFRVHVETSALGELENSLLDAADFYVHNPILTTPVEPFHTLLHTICIGRGHNMWAIEAENVKTNFYVSHDGEVSLSKRWNADGLNYATLDDPWERIVNSELFQKLSDFRNELFRNKSPCVFCAYLDLCGGFLRAIDASWPCELWQQVFCVLRDEAKKGKELLQRIEQMSDQKSEAQ